jgi:hypothetical protein
VTVNVLSASSVVQLAKMHVVESSCSFVSRHMQVVFETEQADSPSDEMRQVRAHDGRSPKTAPLTAAATSCGIKIAGSSSVRTCVTIFMVVVCGGV